MFVASQLKTDSVQCGSRYSTRNEMFPGTGHLKASFVGRAQVLNGLREQDLFLPRNLDSNAYAYTKQHDVV